MYLWSDGTKSFIPSEEGEKEAGATEIQSEISTAPKDLGFELEKGDKVGGDQKYKLPRAEATKLRRRNIVVKSDGKLDFAE